MKSILNIEYYSTSTVGRASRLRPHSQIASRAERCREVSGPLHLEYGSPQYAREGDRRGESNGREKGKREVGGR